jgi:hypothetical protein
VQDGRLADKCCNLCDDVPEIYRGTGNGFFANTSGTGNDIDFRAATVSPSTWSSIR